MERKFQIPKMNDEELLKWYSTIKPIFIVSYLRELTLTELKDTSFISIFDFGDTVDYSKLSILSDIKCLHIKAYNKRFAPSVSEVISQIPKELIEKVVAFEIMAGPVGEEDIYQSESKCGYHVSIVRLYESKNDSNREAALLPYPSPEAKCPIGMTKKDFAHIKQSI